MRRLGSLALKAILLSILETVTNAQQQTTTSDDYLRRLFARTEAKHRGSRRNLDRILREQPQFWTGLHAVAARLKTHPAWLLNVMAAESLFDPDAHNPLPGQTASGLLQIIERTARSMGTTTEEIRRMSPIEQLRFVEKYFEPFRGRLNTLADVYAAVFRGAVIVGGDAAVAVDSNKERHIYALNKSLDLDKDGRITKGELSLAALSIGRFQPTPMAASSSDDRSSERPRQTRSIYVRREKLR